MPAAPTTTVALPPFGARIERFVHLCYVKSRQGDLPPQLAAEHQLLRESLNQDVQPGPPAAWACDVVPEDDPKGVDVGLFAEAAATSCCRLVLPDEKPKPKPKSRRKSRRKSTGGGSR